MSTSIACCKSQPKGPGYGSAVEAMKNGPSESILLVTCVRPDKSGPDYLATVDVDPNSPSYATVIERTEMSYVGDEVHHSGWNTCSSCFNDPTKCRNRLILPCLNSDRIYVVKVEKESDLKREGFSRYVTTLIQTIEPHQLHSFDVSAPHTTHCLPNGKLMISCLGNKSGNNRGTFLVIDPPTDLNDQYVPSELWNKQDVPFGYDYWYQPRHDVMVSTEWGSPCSFKQGFSPDHLSAGKYGSSIHFWQWSTGKLIQTIDLKTIVSDTWMPLEVRFMHNPDVAEGFVGCALSGNVFRFFRPIDSKEWLAEEVIKIPSKTVTGWSMEKLPSLITDILISLDDQFLYLSAWGFGEIRQYHIGRSSSSPPLVGIVRIGGIISNPLVKVLQDDEKDLINEKQIMNAINGVKIRGSPQMLQLSLDGLRLYATNSLHSAWDRQFYPEMVQNGSQMIKIDVDTKCGGMKVNQGFVVDFGNEPNGPSLAHEMRYPGGDCTSDIWI